jgi:hypothetical protein
MQGQIWVKVENSGLEEGESQSSQVNTKHPEKIYQKQKASGKVELSQPYCVHNRNQCLASAGARVAYSEEKLSTIV